MVAAAVLVAAGLWLAAVGATMALRPQQALNLLAKTAATYRANLIEQIPRLIAGAAMVLRAPLSNYPAAFEMVGWFVAVTSVALLLAPLKWHSGYARWWARRLPHWAVRAIAPFSVAGGAALIYTTF